MAAMGPGAQGALPDWRTCENKARAANVCGTPVSITGAARAAHAGQHLLMGANRWSAPARPHSP
eukprot:6801081-Lingulodinium_polyedra.AAC.1